MLAEIFIRLCLDLKSKKLGIKFVFGIEQRSKFNFRALVHYLADIQRREKEMRRLNELMNSKEINEETEQYSDQESEATKSQERAKKQPVMMKFIKKGLSTRVQNIKDIRTSRKSEIELNKMLKAASIGVPLTRSLTIMKRPPNRTTTLDNSQHQEIQSLTPTRASNKRDMLTSTSSIG